MRIAERRIGSPEPCFLIAEAGVNHNGDMKMAHELIEKARDVGADAVKFQTFRAEKVVVQEADKAEYQKKVTGEEESQYEMLKKLELKGEDFQDLKEKCRKEGLAFLSTPYNFEDADLLEDIGVEAFKVASGQLVELPFLEHLAKKKRPILLSTGMADLAEVYEAVETIRNAGNEEILLLQCTTNYPSDIADANVRAMRTMADALDLMPGYSDHVPSDHASYAAVAMGAVAIEKHFTLDRELPGPDHKASLDPEGFEAFVQGVRRVEKAMGSSVKRPTEAERKNTEGMRRSIVVDRDMKKGETLKRSDLAFKRPAVGIQPKLLDEVLGRELLVDLSRDQALRWSHLGG